MDFLLLFVVFKKVIKIKPKIFYVELSFRQFNFTQVPLKMTILKHLRGISRIVPVPSRDHTRAFPVVFFPG